MHKSKNMLLLFLFAFFFMASCSRDGRENISNKQVITLEEVGNKTETLSDEDKDTLTYQAVSELVENQLRKVDGIKEIDVDVEKEKDNLYVEVKVEYEEEIENKEYLQEVRKLCDEKDIVLIFDEVQCGVGRLGTFYAYQSFGVVPDCLCMAKGIAGGIPCGVLMAKDKIAESFKPGDHASTFGGNPLATAAGNVADQTGGQ